MHVRTDYETDILGKKESVPHIDSFFLRNSEKRGTIDETESGSEKER